MLRRALPIFVREFGLYHAETLNTANILASAHERLGEYREQKVLLMKVLAAAHAKECQPGLVPKALYYLALYQLEHGNPSMALPLINSIPQDKAYNKQTHEATHRILSRLL